MEDLEEIQTGSGPSSFFKVMINNFTERMLIPIAFTVETELADNIVEYYFLSTHKGTWRVGVYAENQMKVYFTTGWSTFVAHHRLLAGEILVFEQTSNSSFFVHVYGHSGCGKDFDGCMKITVKEELSDDPSDVFATEADLKRKKLSESPKATVSSSCNFSGILNPTNCHPKKCYMHIPINFVRSAELHTTESILVEDTHGKVWKFILDRATCYTNGSRRIKLQKNWRKFVEANNLQISEKYIFELDLTRGKVDTPLLKFSRLS